MSDIEKRIRILYKKVDVEELPSERACYGYIKLLDGIKNELINKNKIDEEDFEDIELGSLFGTNDEDINEAINEVQAQLEEIASTLGIDLDEENHPKQSFTNSPAVHIYNTNMQSQYQEQTQYQSSNINFLKRELEKELSKDYPNESKIKKVISDIINTAKSSAAGIISGIILKVLGA